MSKKTKSPKGQQTMKTFMTSVPVRAWGYAHVMVDAYSLMDARVFFNQMEDDQILDDDNIDWYDMSGTPIEATWRKDAIAGLAEVE